MEIEANTKVTNADLGLVRPSNTRSVRADSQTPAARIVQT